MDVAITVLLALFTAGTLTIAALLAAAVYGDHRAAKARHHAPGRVVDQFDSEKGITR